MITNLHTNTFLLAMFFVLVSKTKQKLCLSKVDQAGVNNGNFVI